MLRQHPEEPTDRCAEHPQQALVATAPALAERDTAHELTGLVGGVVPT